MEVAPTSNCNTTTKSKRFVIAGPWNVGLASEEPEDKIPVKEEGATRFVCLSDTHTHHDPIVVPDGDVLLHAGDFTLDGSAISVSNFCKFLTAQPHKHKVVIAGNHDITFQPEFYETNWNRWHLKRGKQDAVAVKESLAACCTYLEDSETTINGIRIYGSPWQPAFGGWAFNLERGPEIRVKWKKIPEGIDVLMTHGPPKGQGSLAYPRTETGCEDLLRVVRHIKPLVHIFGHIHESYGVTKDENTVYINACNSNMRYKPLNRPIVFDVKAS